MNHFTFPAGHPLREEQDAIRTAKANNPNAPGLIGLGIGAGLYTITLTIREGRKTTTRPLSAPMPRSATLAALRTLSL